MISVADCERVQTGWFIARAEAMGGEVWTDGGMQWTEGPDGLNLMFPTSIDADAVNRGVARARAHRLTIVGAWLGLGVDATALAEAGFDEGWSPWWMTADLADVPPPGHPGVRLDHDGADYRGEHAGYRDQLALGPPRAWHAVAHTEDGRFAGRAWSFLAGELAGVFDMEVWPPFRRRGLGTALLAAVCAAARDGGARHAVLNATPDGEALYRTCGFTRIGEGITWWHHLAAW